jgi:hypothetical protein
VETTSIFETADLQLRDMDTSGQYNDLYDNGRWCDIDEAMRLIQFHPDILLDSHEINLLQMDRLTNPRLHSYMASAVIQEIDTSQTGNPDDIATAIIAQADARYDARQAPVPAAATSDSDITTGDPPQAAAKATEQMTDADNQERATLQRVCGCEV